MAKKFSQFDIAASIAGDESFVGLKDGDNSQFPFADVLSYFQNEFDTDYWPLSGTADLTDDVNIDGNFSVYFGDSDPLEEFYVVVSDGTERAAFDLAIGITALNYVNVADPSIASSIQIFDGEISLEVSDGVDTSSLTLTPDSLDIDIDGDLNVTLEGGLISIPGAVSGETFAIRSINGNDYRGLGFEGIGGFGTYSLPIFGFYNLVTGARSILRPSNGIEMYSSDGSIANVFNIQGVEGATGARFIDGRATKRGIEYSADGYVTQARSLADKGYVDNAVGVGTGFTLPTYTIATLPSASPAGKLIWVSDEGGGPTVAFSDNTDWRRVYDGNIVSA